MANTNFSNFPPLNTIINNSALSKLFYNKLDAVVSFATLSKSKIESVLTGRLTSHSHPLNDGVSLQLPWNIDFTTLFSEYTIVDGLVTQVDYWETSAKTNKLFTKVITYTGTNATTIVLTDLKSGKVLTTTITYSGSDVLTITKTVS